MGIGLVWLVNIVCVSLCFVMWLFTLGGLLFAGWVIALVIWLVVVNSVVIAATTYSLFVRFLYVVLWLISASICFVCLLDGGLFATFVCVS